MNRTDKTSDGSPAGYDAFLSYSQAADGRLAPTIQRGLHRVATRLRRIGVGALALLLAVAVVLGGVATWLRQQTVEQRDQALSRELAARSEAIGDSDPELARLLSLAATRVSPAAEAHASMLIAAARPGVGTIATGDAPVDSLAFSPDGSLPATTGPRGQVRLWDLASRRSTGELDADAQRAVAFSPAGRTLVTAGDDGAVRLWDAATRGRVGELAAHTGPVYAAAFSPDGGLPATGSSDGSVRLWDVATRKQVSDPHLRHHGPVRSVAFDPDGTTLASGGEDHAVRLWEVG
ncbi:WD40 repeat domain-containing protein [Saccharothrix luteola]|uniref:WD40 repeat domain-containing protein n=1 Tax=Saccharothrix luteola TaxID=2893018 RepID=UPI001E4A1A2C|nr:hypothetical protein [Saccharothrix luteola]MCC8246170.1 hypothetical protein [Saccharothrix luteola]